MNRSQEPPAATKNTDEPSVRIGALVPLTRPGWVEAGQHLLAGLDLAVREVNDAGGVRGKPLELIVRDTAADPQKATAAVDELVDMGVVALAGEYHSVVARAAAARASALGLPFLCSSAVLDALTEQPTDWVARLAPAQSHGWQIYADFLLSEGHKRIAVATLPSVYWASGTRILTDYFAPRGGSVLELDVNALSAEAICDELVDSRVTALLLLVGYPEPAISIVRSVRRDRRLGEILIGAPAGQPEFAGWATLLGDEGRAIPFLRYLPEHLSPLGARVAVAIRERLGEAPSFVAYEGYDTILVLADLLRSHSSGRVWSASFWSRVIRTIPITFASFARTETRCSRQYYPIYAAHIDAEVPFCTQNGQEIWLRHRPADAISDGVRLAAHQVPCQKSLNASINDAGLSSWTLWPA
jgi:ABC-type branched-subunit amino acid transport system substrate-binding protein